MIKIVNKINKLQSAKATSLMRFIIKYKKQVEPGNESKKILMKLFYNSFA